MEKNELKKELIRSKAEAELSHYRLGRLLGIQIEHPSN